MRYGFIIIKVLNLIIIMSCYMVIGFLTQDLFQKCCLSCRIGWRLLLLFKTMASSKTRGKIRW